MKKINWRRQFRPTQVSFYFLIVLCYLLAIIFGGCASKARFYNGENIMVAKIEMDRTGEATYKDKDKEFTYNTKQLSWWDKFITPVIQTGVDKAGGVELAP